jgi:hypothetical protein
MWNKRELKPKKIKKDPRPYWNICDECAKKQGGKCTSNAITVSSGDCPYCGVKDVMLIPTCDFNWPDGTKAVWD